MRIPREAPATISIAPLRASAFKCSSAALGDLKPNSREISARVGGIPVVSKWRFKSSSTSCCLAVNGLIYTPVTLYRITVSIYRKVTIATTIF